ncbi:hypothetical protein BJ322DRAFT_1183841 [Thelephora terrestris]|jgi:hypothetical protein|uniref:Uncharacterized protein n=1 Tax=Thelephora terrestris TaxID=56493 RepID=A0A9P6LA38_9AGAM|nr:hypothetical protein BJ322DRAFT_1183841 [Thelephora terrestris]
MLRLASLVSLLFLTLSQTLVSGSPCVSFDANFNLLALGFGGKDWNVGTQDVWATATTATDITTTGRPPFDGTGTTCYLAQFFNAVYVLNGDAKNPNSIYIYDAGAKSWSTQVTTPGSFSYSSFDAILDHDTNVFYALSTNGSLYNLDMGTMKTANSTAIAWNNVQQPPFPANYKPVMALAQNHIHFLDVGTDGPGNARIFVIHYSYFQPEVQSYPGSKTFPATHGQATSFFNQTGVQQEFAFIPDDFSSTYVINVENNSTRTLPPPTVQDTKSSYVAGITSLVQLDSAGSVFFVPYTPGDDTVNVNAAWSSVKSLVGLVSTANLQSNSTSNSTSGNQTSNSNSTNSTPSDHDGAPSSYPVTSGLVGLAVLFAILGFF